MASVEDVLDQVDGLRRDAAKRVQDRFGSVNALASATTDQLTEITGIGRVMADRIHAAAAGALGGIASAASDSSSPGGSTPPSTATGGSSGIVGKVVGTAATTAKQVADRASEPARKIVDKVVRRGR